MTPEIPFKRQAVEPVECLKRGWELIKDQYWLFVGMTFIGLLVGGAVPLGILLGPMMCGLYLTFFKKRRGEPIEFGTLFKGFDFFGPSLVATLLHVVPIVAIVVPAYFLFLHQHDRIGGSAGWQRSEPGGVFWRHGRVYRLLAGRDGRDYLHLDRIYV